MTATIESTRAELLRLRKWPAVWVIISAWLLLNALFGYVFTYASYATGDTAFSVEDTTAANLLADVLPANVAHAMIQGTPIFGGALMMVLGALVSGSSYAWGTWKTVFTQGPPRRAVVLGSMAALTAFVVLTVLATLALCLGLSLLVAVIESQPVTLPTAGALLESLGIGLLVLEAFALLGYLLGTLARGPALSVGLGLVWILVVENLLRGVSTLLGPIEAFTKLLPGTGAGSLIGSVIGTDGPNPPPGALDTLSTGPAAASLLAYLVLAPVIASWLVTRRDVA
jgi:ABC-2 type transport system permease protein